MTDSLNDTTDASRAEPAFTSRSSLATAGDYYALLKPGVMRLVVFTALVGLMAAPGTIHPLIAFSAILSIAVGAGASAALNMWYDADIDAGMQRTKNRPVPAGIIRKEEALNLGVTLSLLSVLSMALMVNILSAALLAFTILFYAIVYTMWLKRSTPQNIVIGGVAGALPPMIGWAAVTNSISWESFSLFAIIFMWTPPHFWALSLYRSGDYENVGIPMMPVTAGKASTRRQMVLYTVLLFPVSIIPWVLNIASAAYLALAVVLSSVFIGIAVRVWALGDGRLDGGEDADKAARSMFFYSLVYLFLLFFEILVEHSARAMWGS